MASVRGNRPQTISAADLRQYLGDWRHGHGPVSDRIALALENAMGRGELPEGSRLPSERELADMLDVSRSTVIRSLDALAERHSIVRVHGSGTFVGPAVPNPERADGPRPLHAQFRVDDREAQGLLAGVFPSPAGLPPEAFALSFEDINGTEAADQIGSGYSIAGLTRTRLRVARHLEDHGGRPSPDSVIVTTGATQALSLAFDIMITADDVVIVDPLAYPTTIALLRARGARIVRAPARDDGSTDVEELYRRAIALKAAMVVAMPVCNAATGHSYPRGAMIALADLASRGVAIVEDRALADFDPSALPPLSQVTDGPNVVSVGSFNKLYWGGLRMGWMSVHESLVASIVRAKAKVDSGASVPAQIILERLLDSHDVILSARRGSLDQTRNAATELLTREERGWRIDGAPVGPTMWLRLPTPDSAAFVNYAYSHGISIAYGGDFRSDGRTSPDVRISLTGGMDWTVESLTRLLLLWDSYLNGH